MSIFLQEDDRAPDHLALGGVAEGLLRLRQRDPARLLDLVVVVGDVTADVGEQEEAHRLADRAPVAPIPVARLAELTHGLGNDPGLLANLALGRLHGALTRIDVPLRQREHARAVGRAASGDDRDHLIAAHDDAAGGEAPPGGRLTPPFAHDLEDIVLQRLGIVDDEAPPALRDHPCALEHREKARGRLA